ncbi:MAG: hypothetical protein CMB97_00525 [Flavobacteriaceae bacterium]|nr:hypothetical protein [Flavobacteriaceae bacterium]
MVKESIDNLIRNRFSELSDTNLVKEYIDEENFELREILNWLGKKKNAKILDVGCGKGKFTRYLAKLGAEMKGIDATAEFIDMARLKTVNDEQYFVCGADNLLFDDNSFDAVVCVEVLEHIQNTSKALSEMFRVLKEKGKLIIIDKNLYGLHPKWFIPAILWKKVKEHSNRWMYPKGFPFTEKWFNPGRLKKKIEKFCNYCEINYLVFPGKSKSLFRILPKYINLYVSWRAVK